MIVFDTGALIALERNRRDVVVLVGEARRTNDTILVPTGCVAQAWREPRRQARLAAFLRLPNVRIAPLDDEEARRVGLLLAAARASDVVDAQVAVCALRGGHVVLTSDPNDLQRLAPTIRAERV